MRNTRRSIAFVLPLALAIPCPAAAQSHAGVVIDAVSALPVEGAVVVINHTTRTTTDAMGRYVVDAAPGLDAESVLATHPGWLTAYATAPLGSPTTGLVLTLPAYPARTDGFVPESPSACTTCHEGHDEGWSGEGGFDSSAHARSALNPRVLDIWRGTASGRADAAACAAVSGELASITRTDGVTASRCYVGVGLLPDMNAQCGHAGQPRCDDHAAPTAARPTYWSDCAGCHTPGVAIRVPEVLDLDQAEAAWTPSSVTCAGCHRIADVGDPNAPGVLAGATTIRGALASGLPLALGPLDDAGGPLMVTGHAPLFAESRLCAPCHQDTFTAPGMIPRWAAVGGVPSEQTYAEWLESPYATGARERTCQDCHMPTLAARGIGPGVSEIGAGGPPRSRDVMHTHDFPPFTSPADLETALDLSIDARREGSAIVVDASLTNLGVGHGFPSGVTSRNALLVVTAELPSGRLVEIGGDVLPLYAGSYDRGTVVSASGSTIVLDHAIDTSAEGRELRLWAGGTSLRDHESFGLLRALPPSERRMTVGVALGRYEIVRVRGAEVDVRTDGAPLELLAGAAFAIGDDERLAGVAGMALAKVNVAADGTQNVPFWRAVDVVWDNRLAPDETQRTEHTFSLPSAAAGTVTIRARLLYRRAFADLAAQRGWDGNEHLVLERETTLEIAGADAGAPRDASAQDAAAADAAGPAGTSGCTCRAGAAPRPGAWIGIGVLAWVVVRARRSAASVCRRASIAPCTTR